VEVWENNGSRIEVDLVLDQIKRDLGDLNISESLQRLANSRVLITGANGMLGTYFTLALALLQMQLGQSPKVAAISRKLVPRFQSLSIKTRLPGNAEALVLDGEVDVVIHAASPAHASSFMADPTGCFEVNVEWAQTLAQACIKSDTRLVYISSGEVYGISPPVPTAETDFGGLDPVNPRNVYAVSKRAGEALLSSMALGQNLDLRICRLFHTFGPGIRIDEPRLFGVLLEAALNERDCAIMGNADATRSFLYSFDALDGIAHVLDKCSPGAAVNIAGSQAHTVGETAIRSMSAMTNGKHGVQFVKSTTEFTQLVSEIARNEANTSLLRSTGWAPQVSLEGSFVRTLNSLKSC